MDKIPMTPGGLKNLEEELKELKSKERPDIIKAISLFFSIYSYSILENRTIYQLLDFDIFTNSTYYEYGIFCEIFLVILYLHALKNFRCIVQSL